LKLAFRQKTAFTVSAEKYDEARGLRGLREEEVVDMASRFSGDLGQKLRSYLHKLAVR
jgi:hypothetical protein